MSAKGCFLKCIPVQKTFKLNGTYTEKLTVFSQTVKVSSSFRTFVSKTHPQLNLASHKEDFKEEPTEAPPQLFFHTYQGKALSKFNRELEKARRPSKAFEICRLIVEGGIQPDVHTYNLLLKAIVSLKDFNLGLNYFHDMIGMGIQPDITTINNMLVLANKNGTYVEHVLALADAFNVGLKGTSRELILNGLLLREDYTHMLATWDHWRQDPKILKDLTPACFQMMIQAYLYVGHTDIAIRMVQDCDKRVISAPSPQWLLNFLRAFTQLRYVDGAYFLLRRILEYQVLPDEGTCLDVLHTAARAGHGELIRLAVEILVQLEVDLAEWHFVPILEGYFKSKSEADWKQAFHILKIMESSNIPITPNAILPPLIEHFSQNAHLVPNLEKAFKENDVTHLILWNLLIGIYTKLDKMSSAMTIYRTLASKDSKILPDILTFSLLFEGAANSESLAIGEQLESDLVARNFTPTVDIYRHLITMALYKKDDYEAAFMNLEAIKALGETPPASVYKSIVRRCAFERDPRVYDALDEMRFFGYNPSPGLLRLVETGGIRLAATFGDQSNNPIDEVNDDKY